jgi:hypothetical protein
MVKKITESKRSTKPVTPAATPSRTEMFDAAQVKLGAAAAISDLVAMLEIHEGVDSLKQNTLSTTMLHVEELIDEAKQMLMKAREAA